jgi:uncharacterized membrane protein YqaE (UPF0057 family)
MAASVHSRVAWHVQNSGIRFSSVVKQIPTDIAGAIHCELGTKLPPELRLTYSLYFRSTTMAFTASDILKIIAAVILPPLGVFLEKGVCDVDILINILLTILGYIPGIIHGKSLGPASQYSGFCSALDSGMSLSPCIHLAVCFVNYLS